MIESSFKLTYLFRKYDYLYLLFALLPLFFVESYGRDFDAIFHFFMAQAAVVHPDFLLNSWAKPPFSLLMVLPANAFGYLGVVALNGLFLFGSFFLLYRMALRNKIPWAGLLLLGPLLFRRLIPFSYSGLTEPLAGFYLVMLCFLWQDRRHRLFYILSAFSFLFRQEFILIIPLAALLGMHNRDSRAWLLLVGIPIYESLNFLFNPEEFLNSFTGGYDTGASVYGSGSLSHYFDRLSIMVGHPLYVVLALVLALFLIFKLSLKGLHKRNLSLEEGSAWLMASVIIGVFSAHTLVWYRGIYASAGMDRVLLPIVAPSFYLMLMYAARIKSKLGRYLLPSLALFMLLSNWLFQVERSKHYYQEVFAKDEVKVLLETHLAKAERAGLMGLQTNHPAIALYFDLNPKQEECRVDLDRLINEEAGPQILILPLKFADQAKELNYELIANGENSLYFKGL